MKVIFLFLFVISSVFSAVKTPSDVYSEVVILKKAVEFLRLENGIKEPLQIIVVQKNKLPRHVLQKSIEVLRKIRKYREINNMGKITVPPVPPRDITPSDVYRNVTRLKKEVSFLLKDKTPLKNIKYKKFHGKTPSDVYKELWEISIGFDKLLGQGFTPTDVYAQTQQILEIIKFLRLTQRQEDTIIKPVLKKNQHPNHALYKSVKLIQKIHKAEKKLWMKAVPIPKIEEKVISPTEVYDSLQTVVAELNRISRRLGVERSFKLKTQKKRKTPSDVVQNIEYAIALFPSFDFSKTLNQYPKSSLLKTPSDIFALSEYILQKLQYIKSQKGIKIDPKETTYIHDLKPIHVYEKGIEDLEKIEKLKRLEGFAPSQTPTSATTKITPSEVYELILRLDDEIGLLYHGYLAKNTILSSYRELFNKKNYRRKTPSDVYDNLWKISHELDTMLNQEYTPNETYILSRNIENNLLKMESYFLGKTLYIKEVKSKSKRPKDVFLKSLKILKKLEFIKKRGNFKSAQIVIPRDNIITPTSVYNALRIISATISEIDVFYGIPQSQKIEKIKIDKTPTDVYEVIQKADDIVSKIIQDSSYEN